MSHRWGCPSRYEAERQGEDAFRRHERENPHESRYGRDGCPEAERAWDQGYRLAERRDEERQAEEAAHARASHARAQQAQYEREQEEAHYYQQQQQYPGPAQEEENYCATAGHPYHGDDATGPRCMCGERRDFKARTGGE